MSVVGAVLFTGLAGVVLLRAVAPQRQAARVGRPALGGEQAGCSGGGVGVGVGFPVTREAADVT